MALLRAVSTIGFYTLLSRLFGFARDVLVARYLGAGMLADAFFVAFKLPNFLRRLFAEGAFNAAFVPLFAGTLAEQGEAEARKFAEEIFAVLATVLLLIVALAEIFMPYLLLAFAPGFADEPQKFALTVLLARFTFPYIFFISLVTLLGGVLNSVDRFAAVAAAPILLNISLIVALVLLTPLMETSAHALALGVALAGLAQFLWLAGAAARAGLLPQWRLPKLSPSVKRLLKLAAPAAFGAGVAQVNLLVDVVLASLFSGAVSWLYYADRLNELPIGVIGVAVGTALLPMLSKAIRNGDEAEAVQKLNQALLLALALTLPATAALILVPTPLIATIYQHGAFAAADTAAVVPAMVAYAIGLPAFILVKLFGPCFFAREDTKTPVKIAVLCVGINLCGNLILMQFWQHVGLALATSLAGWVNALLMGWVLHKRGHLRPDKALWRQLDKVAIATVVMGLAICWLPEALAWDTVTQRALSLATLVLTGMAVYGAAVWAMGIGKALLRFSR